MHQWWSLLRLMVGTVVLTDTMDPVGTAITELNLIGVSPMAVWEGPPDPKEGGSFPSACVVLLRSHILIDVSL